MTVSPFILRPATQEEIHYIHDLNAASWAGDLDLKTYHERERTLASAPLTRNGGISCWVLVDPSDDSAKILSSCETIKKEAYISKPPINGERVSTISEVIAHAIGSVFTPEEHRGHGYAGIMLRLLSDTLIRTNEYGFSVLYSDIGKRFYAKHGWYPHASTHLEIPATAPKDIGDVRLLRASDAPALCVRDITSIEDELAKIVPHGQTKIALVPDYQTMEWHWTREEFVAPVLRPHMNRKPEFKGAITADGQRWILWNRDFGKKSSQLFVLRVVNQSSGTNQEQEMQELAKLISAAVNEAFKWELKKITLWNPGETTLRAATMVAGQELKVVSREMDSIPSLMMHDEDGSDEDAVEWIANEKYGWC